MICNKTYLSVAGPDDGARGRVTALRGRTQGAKAARGAFTLIELLVVIAIIAILAAVLLPVLHQAQLRGEAAACIDHQKQLATAWLMYANDNSDYCPGNEWGANGGEEDWPLYKGKLYRGGTIAPCTNWISGWIDPSGTSPNTDIAGVIGMTGESDNTNSDLLVDPSYATLGDYTKNPQLFICPACEVKVDTYPGGPKTASEIRSVSMNSWVGFVTEPTEGTTPQTTYKIFTKTSSISAGIGPSDLFVFMEERGESIDDGWFEVQEVSGTSISTTMANWPTDYHNNAASIGFADGHVEVHRWAGTGQASGGVNYGTTVPQEPVITTKWGGATPANFTDLIWLQNHATVLVN
jgi:prepilin-type N-terminal cleavage/methylation domain-containing protein/prepilin-type processing-associated H-X9-DG protein